MTKQRYNPLITIAGLLFCLGLVALASGDTRNMLLLDLMAGFVWLLAPLWRLRR